ncbi:MAG: NAD(+) kinase [Gammaproteobacteria bacterium]
MTKPGFQSIALIARDHDPQVRETVSTLTTLLLSLGREVWVADNTNYVDLEGVKASPEHELSEHCELVISVGGDGTMLQAAHLIRSATLPLLGINRGRRGFLADIRPHELEASITRILSGDYLRESRMLLTATLRNGEHIKQRLHALNDIVVQRGAMGQMLDFEVRVDDAYVTTHRGDGLIITTPTGSTAYSLSCGGPIMQPGLNAVAMVPICPHTLSDRPVVIPGSSHIEVSVKHRFDADAFVTVDGRMSDEIEVGDTLVVTQAIDRITLLHPNDYDYFEVLRSKLNWGQYGQPEKA